jgi:sec-independent protein translocase protein TatA
MSDLMGDFAKGIKSFKKGLAEEPEAEPGKTETIDHQKPAAAASGSGSAI